MSTIAVDNLKPSAGGTSFTTRGIAKAWVNFNGTGVVAIRDSENVSSVTDNGTGDYAVNLTNDMGNVNYSGVGAGSIGTASVTAYTLSPSSYATGSIGVESKRCLNGGTVAALDFDYSNVTVTGDLA